MLQFCFRSLSSFCVSCRWSGTSPSRFRTAPRSCQCGERPSVSVSSGSAAAPSLWYQYFSRYTARHTQSSATSRKEKHVNFSMMSQKHRQMSFVNASPLQEGEANAAQFISPKQPKTFRAKKEHVVRQHFLLRRTPLGTFTAPMECVSHCTFTILGCWAGSTLLLSSWASTSLLWLSSVSATPPCS